MVKLEEPKPLLRSVLRFGWRVDLRMVSGTEFLYVLITSIDESWVAVWHEDFEEAGTGPAIVRLDRIEWARALRRQNDIPHQAFPRQAFPKP